MNDDLKLEGLVKPPEQLFSSTSVCNGGKQKAGGSSIVTGNLQFLFGSICRES
jgi:hypothetical protein